MTYPLHPHLYFRVHDSFLPCPRRGERVLHLALASVSFHQCLGTTGRGALPPVASGSHATERGGGRYTWDLVPFPPQLTRLSGLHMRKEHGPAFLLHARASARGAVVCVFADPHLTSINAKQFSRILLSSDLMHPFQASTGWHLLLCGHTWPCLDFR